MITTSARETLQTGSVCGASDILTRYTAPHRLRGIGLLVREAGSEERQAPVRRSIYDPISILTRSLQYNQEFNANYRCQSTSLRQHSRGAHTAR